MIISLIGELKVGSNKSFLLGKWDESGVLWRKKPEN